MRPPEGYFCENPLRLVAEEFCEKGLIFVDGGFVAYMQGEEGVLWLREIFVHPDRRREGIGTNLMRLLAQRTEWLMTFTSVHEYAFNQLLISLDVPMIHQEGEFMTWRMKYEDLLSDG